MSASTQWVAIGSSRDKVPCDLSHGRAPRGPHGPRTGQLHEIAAEIIEHAALNHDCIVALQAYCEFVAAATCKGKMTIEEAGAQVADWQSLFTTVYPTPSSLPQAIEAVEQHNLSFWDALLGWLYSN